MEVKAEVRRGVGKEDERRWGREWRRTTKVLGKRNSGMSVLARASLHVSFLYSLDAFMDTIFQPCIVFQSRRKHQQERPSFLYAHKMQRLILIVPVYPQSDNPHVHSTRCPNSYLNFFCSASCIMHHARKAIPVLAPMGYTSGIRCFCVTTLCCQLWDWEMMCGCLCWMMVRLL